MQKKLTDKGLKFLEAGKFNEAKIILSTLIAQYPNNTEGFHLLAITMMQDGHLLAAYDLALKCIEREPLVSCYYNTLASIELKRDKIDFAEQYFLDAIRLDPQEIDYRYNIANFYNKTNQASKAIDYYKAILQANASDNTALKGLTLIYFFEDSLEIALESAKAWNEQHPTAEEALYYYGLCLHGLGDIKGALAIYDQALKINPYNDQVFTAIALAFKESNNLALAEINLHKALSIDSYNPNSLYHLGIIEYLKGHIEDARELFQDAINIDDQLAEPIFGLGLIESFAHNHEQALHYYTIAHQMGRHLFEAQSAIATTLLKLTKFLEGWEYYCVTLERQLCKEELIKQCPQLFKLSDWAHTTQKEWATNQKKPILKSTIEHAAKTNLLVWLDTSINEEILFASMFGDLLAVANSQQIDNIVIQTSAKLHSLFSRSFPNIRFVTNISKQLLSKYHIQQQVSLTSLGKYLRQTMTDFPLQSYYLEVDANELSSIEQRYQELFPNKVRVGVIWKDQYYKLSDAELDLLRNDNIQLISLQTGPNLQKKHIFIDQSVNCATEYDKLAAQIKTLDYVIALDTTSAHLAGALGVNTHVLLEPNANWYWFINRHTSPWYSSVFLHQKDPDNSFKTSLKKIMEIIEKSRAH
jgi:tetratricopeptide (TPR) repeat protein